MKIFHYIENISGYTCSSRASTLSSQLRDVVGQTEDEESSSGYDSFDGVNSLSNPTYSGPTIHSRYAAALNNSDTKYNSEVQARPELSLSFFGRLKTGPPQCQTGASSLMP